MIQWNKLKISGTDLKLITKITKRAFTLFQELGYGVNPMTVSMDLEVVHGTIGLQLNEMLEADNGNFMHDITGIYSNIDRETGELKNYFSPRFSKR